METPGQRDARCLIEKIGREHILNGAIKGTRFELLVSNCLEILSSQLYEKSTHFLLELIQNADDNTYDNPSPTLSFSYKPGSLRIDCNEVGFTAENVEAICAISRSTKSGKTSDGEYIGEKGIGFKSVFKASDVVWISSREFTFKFDKREFLGMVAPIWADFPEPTRPGCTSIYLQLSEGYEEETLIHELLTFDTNLLIFLRRVQEINIRVSRPDDLNEPVWEKRIRKTESHQGADRVTVLYAGKSTFQYLIRTHVIKDLPKEHKRPDWPQTKILLAFPTAEFPEQPRLIPQNVYAFLPIRNYGLKFLLQGDFLLTASREDIESTLPWNRTIRDALADAFLFSVDHFNKGKLKYAWSYYLPSASTAASSFLEPAIASILAQLKESPVLESCAGTMVKASSLKHVPLDPFGDKDGIPFTLSSYTADGYLSLKYPAWAIEGTNSIGASQLSPREFLADLNSAITQDPTIFRTKPSTWHSQLAETLVKLSTDAELMFLIQDICLIPLQDGNWTSARGQSMFFSKSETSLEIPSGIEVLIVDSSAESDPNRRKLFTTLGVKAWEAPEICRLIVRVHESADFDPKKLAVEQLISHAAFLYNASWQPPKTVDLWFATMQDERCLGRKLYIPGSSETNSPAARIFAQLQKKFAVIHNDYLKAFASSPDWPAWLVSNLGLSKVPRLVTPHVESKPQPTQPTLALESPRLSPSILTNQAGQSGIDPIPDDVLEDFDFDKFLHTEDKDVTNTAVAFFDEFSLNKQYTASGSTSSEDGSADSPIRASHGRPAGSLRTREDRPKDGRKRKNSLSDSIPEVLIPVPPLARVGDTEKTFALSEEFTFMFRECHSSDVLQLLKDNWHYYSQWIDGVHMKWQDADFLDSSSQLKNSIGACLVQSAKGSLSLQDTVLPTIDRQLDEGRLIPAVVIMDPQHPEWTLLNYFGVIVKPDIHYYLRCLIAISDEPVPDVDNVAYIYEQIEARYKENEELISAAFRERDIILVHLESPRSTKPASWTNMKECISRDITIESKYPTSSYLFRCLISPGGDPIAPIVATATLITSSTKLDDISRLFRDISTALKDVNTSKAAQLLRPLQSKQIFPITNGPGKSKYDNLLDLYNTSWFIADKPLIRESFHGKIPLLALPIEDLPALQDLFRVLRLDGRMLSKLATNRTQAKGRHSTHWAYTASLREKAPFIKALVPHSYHNRMTIIRQIDEVRVSVAIDILQTFMFNLAGTEIQGNPVRGQVCLSDTGHLLNLLMTEECAAAQCPPYELVSLIADACAIKDPNHFSLLFTALSGSSMESIYSTFTQQGIYIKGLVFDKSKNRYRAQRTDLMRIPSPFWGSVNRMGSSYRDSSDAMTFDRFQRGEVVHSRNGDRRLPMKQIIEEIHSRRLVLADDRIDGWDHIQYLGEHMTPKWKETLEANPPVYHLDVVVSKGSKTSSFVITSSQVERMRQHRMHGNAYEVNTDVAVLVRVSDVYSDDLLSAEFFVDPWRLFDSNELTLENDWIFKGAIQENLMGPTRKKRKLNGPSISWAMPAALPAIHQTSMPKFRARKDNETFTHRPLDSGNIRLLYLLPGETRDLLQGVIIHVPYRSPGTYRALSYVWGTNTRTSELMTPDGILRITLSLNKALRGLRHKVKAIMLWVDAICINQKDNKEKAQQIRLLPNIFQSAAATYAFIEGGKGSDKAIEMQMQVRAKAELDERSKNEACPADGVESEIGNDSGSETDPEEGMETNNKMISNVWPSTDGWPADLPRVPASWKGEPTPPLDNPIWTSIAAVFTLSWFRRVWIIQEIVAAQNVKIVCGKWIIDWNELYLAMEIVDRQVQLSDHDSSALKSTWEPFLSLAAQREWEARQLRWSLIMLLENFRYSESTLNRDRLFALLGLASDGNEAAFEPDYDSPLEAIVLKFARVFVRQGRGMQLLYRAGLNQQSDKFASWIPDWTARRPGSLYDSSEGGVTFAASGPQQAKIKCVPDTDELLVDGYEVDVIESISTTSNGEQEWANYFREIDTMVDNAVLSPVRDSREDLKWKVPVAGVLYPKVAVSGGLDLKSSYAALRNYLNSKQKGKAKETNDCPINGTAFASMYTMALEHMATTALPKQSTSYTAVLGDTLHGWRFVITRRGYVGVVPNMASVGDVVVILKGGRVPFLLHASETRSSAFRLVGECYVHSIMNGEGLSLPGVVESKFRLH
ncbi:uncharacterized protein BDZ99DRAFT_518138 [Mytilinidion resinicola]|uniref:Heterokaryon incompatibility domain-containing protein n=1 Tax=Mytilinidion resinicola TaxID=574789 RepID=A0A6A6YUS3_9PEZI|nr:uncharacterized protein BDZ99DRAFT_518138 [Mytilinidion resinicola]KAF2812279.1 hypothetical protein BDZ99DRAFT_518138 [Mytilinidion resinicola]